MNTGEFINALKNPTMLDTLELISTDVQTILTDYTSDPDKIFNCDLNFQDQGTKISILGAIIAFVEMQQDLISNQNFLSVIEQKKELLDQPAFKFANGDTKTPLGFAIAMDKTEIAKMLLEKNPQLLDQPAYNFPDGTLTPLGVVVVNDKTDIAEMLLEKNPQLLDQPASIFNNGDTAKPIAIAIAMDKTEIVKMLLEKDLQLLNQPASIFNNGDTAKPIAIAIANDKTDIVEILLEKDPQLLDQPTFKFANGDTLTPLGYAIANDKTDIVEILLEKNPQLLDKTAYRFNNGDTATPIAIAIAMDKTEIVKILLEKNSQLLDQPAFKFANGDTETPLGYILKRVPQNRYKSEITDLLLKYGANEENLGDSINRLNDEQKQKLEKNKQTKLVYEGKESTTKESENLNKEYFKNLCKQFGAPSLHNQALKDFISNDIITSDQTKSDNIGVHIGDILYQLQSQKFKSPVPYKMLKELQNPQSMFSSLKNRDQYILETIQAYDDEEGRFKPENIFKFEKNLTDYPDFFLKNPEIAERIFELSKDWILNKAEHENREYLSSKFLESCKSPLFPFISEQQQEILALKKETLEEKEARQTQEGLQESAQAPRQQKITNYFSKESVLVKRPGTEVASAKAFKLKGSIEKQSRFNL